MRLASSSRWQATCGQPRELIHASTRGGTGCYRIEQGTDQRISVIRLTSAASAALSRTPARPPRADATGAAAAKGVYIPGLARVAPMALAALSSSLIVPLT